MERGYDKYNLGVSSCALTCPIQMQQNPWSLFRNTRRQATCRQTSLPLAPQYQGTDYTEDGQVFPWDPFQGAPGDRLRRGRTSLPLRYVVAGCPLFRGCLSIEVNGKAMQSGLSELSIISWVSAIQGCLLSGVPL